MSEEVRSPEYHSQILHFGLSHFVQRVWHFRLDSLIIIIFHLCRKLYDFLYLLSGYCAVIVEAILDETVRIGPMSCLPSLQSSHHAVEFASSLQQGLLAVTAVLEGLLSVDTVIEIQRDYRLPIGKEIMRSSTSLGLLFT